MSAKWSRTSRASSRSSARPAPSRLTPTRPGDIRFGLEGEHWSGSFFVQNMSDERAVTFRSNRWAEPRLSILQPRTLGLQFRYEF